MPKTTDVPHELRALNTIFSEKDYKWDYADSFRDWLDFLTESFMPKRVGEYERLKKKHGDLEWFVQMTREWILVQDRMVSGNRDWYDALGTFYEVLCSRGKREILGQFFTPPEVVDLLTRLTVGDQETGKGKLINDPASGSGRMLIAWHAHAPGNFQFAADLDAVCAKMSAVNMCLHGCVGQAVCMDSLNPDDWRFGYHINRRLNQTGVPTIELMSGREECHTWNLWQQQKVEWQAKKATQPDLPKPVPESAKSLVESAKFGQLSLF